MVCRSALAVLLACVALSVAVRAGADEIAYRNFMTAAAESARRADHAAAAAMLEGAIRNAEAFGPHDLRLAAALYALGRAKRGLLDFAQAEAAYRRALGILENAGAGARQQTAAVLNGLGEVRQLQDQLADAESYFST